MIPPNTQVMCVLLKVGAFGRVYRTFHHYFAERNQCVFFLSHGLFKPADSARYRK